LASPILSGVLFLAVASISASATENEKSTPSRTTAEKHEPVGTEKGPVRIENPISDPRSPADTELLDSSTSTVSLDVHAIAENTPRNLMPSPTSITNNKT